MARFGVRIDVHRRAEGVHVLEMHGDLAAGAEQALSAAFAAAGSHARAIIVDFTRVRSIDSHGAGLLIASLARVRGRKVRLLACGLSEPCRRALRLTRLDETVSLYPDEAAAIGSLQAPGRLPRAEALTAGSQALPPTGQPGEWADPVDRLCLPPLPWEAINVNSEGRRPTGPAKGFGALWRRTYTVHLAGSAATPAEVVRVWKERFGSFWPPAGRFYGAGRPIEAGDVALLNLAGPAGITIATAIHVIYAGDESFCFLSAEGHMFGGMITFSAHRESGTTVAQVQALLRASDPLFEIAARLHLTTKPEDQFWQATLKNLATHFGVEGQPVGQQAVRLDRRLQWSEAKKVWYNGAIRGALYAPMRWLRGRGGP